MKNIALIAGGESSEWQIALEGASLVEQNLDRTKYNVYKIILHDGRWNYMDEDGVVSELDRNDFTIEIKGEKIRPDYALILIHGTPGEDGRLQGYLDMMKIPYSSCGFVTSVITFDKSACKRALAGTGIDLAAGNFGRQEYENRPGCRCRRTGPAAVRQTERQRQQFQA